MEAIFKKIETLGAHVKEYADNRLAEVKMGVAEKSSALLARLIAVAIALLVLALFVLFASIAVALVLGKITGELYWGFLIIAGSYLLLGWLLWATKEKLLRLPIMNALLQQLFKEDTDEED
ncbi:MAG: hypothetical protein RL172_594 [Bacteroidota bacterium]|jgi:hypothetical protein